MQKTPSLARAAKRFISKARRGPREVDVEDLLALAAARDHGLAAMLREIAREWPRSGRIEGTSDARVVPLGRWAAYVCAALEGGPPAVVALALTPEERAFHREDGCEEASFALGVLAAIPNEESVTAVLGLARDAARDFNAHRSLAAGCARTLNTLTAFNNAAIICDETAATARAFLHALLERPLTIVESATACLALRGVGDESSLELVGRLPEFPSPWADTATATTRAIRARLRARAAKQ